MVSMLIISRGEGIPDYNLIILHFGANEATFGSTDYNWYKNQMIKIINGLKKAFPNTSILMIGVGDRAIKRGTRFVTDPAVKILIKTQKEIASSTGIAFWNLFEAMGGDNSIDSWVHANPPLALMDYTHPTLQGSVKIADMISKAIMDAYDNQK